MNLSLKKLSILILKLKIKALKLIGFKSRTLKLISTSSCVKLKAPIEHCLDHIMATFPLYDRRLPILCKLISENSSNTVFVDVGANIGDTIALCSLGNDKIEFIAIEPSSVFFKYLTENKKNNEKLFRNVSLIQAFVGSPGQTLKLQHSNGTATPIIQTEQNPTIPSIPLSDFNNKDVSIIKTDTDGWDAEIVLNNLEYIKTKTPILWMEAEVNSLNSYKKWSQILDSDIFDYYSKGMVFDNFGFGVFEGNVKDVKTFLQFNLPHIHKHRLLSTSTFGKPTTFYYDICIFPEKFVKIYDLFHKNLIEFN